MLTIAKKQTMKYKMIDCKSCDGEIPELRLTQYGYNFCVNCSESGNKVKAKHGVNIMMGEGDHTWVETVIMDEDQYNNYQKTYNSNKPEPTLIEFGIEENGK